MKNKKLLSLLIAATMTASAFTGLTVNADESSLIIGKPVLQDDKIIVSVENKAPEAASVRLIVASYQDGTLVSTKLSTQTTAEGTTVFEVGKPDTEEYKVMVWDSTSGMIPLADPVDNLGEPTVEPTVPPSTGPTTEPTVPPTTEPTPTTTPSTEPTVKPMPTPEVANTYLKEENFDTYTETGLETQGTVEQTGTLGKLNLKVGARGSGGDAVSTIAIAGDSNKYLSMISGKTATSQRGASFTFSDECAVPAFAAVAEGNELVLSFDAQFTNSDATLQIFGLTDNTVTSGGQVVNDPYLSVANNEKIPVGEWVKVQLAVDKNGAARMVMTDMYNRLIDVKEFTAVGTAIGAIATYGATSVVNLDNLSVYQAKQNNSELTLTVKEGETPVADATVVLDKMTTVSDQNGQVVVTLPAGPYDYRVSKAGYEATPGEGDDATGVVTLEGAATALDVPLSKQTYVAVPGTVTIDGGQSMVIAPTTETPSTSAAFTVDVIDQKGAPVADGYTTEWSVVPAGSDAADPNVTIAEGVVSVAQGFKAEDGKDYKEYTISAKVTLNGESKTVTKAVRIANSDILYYNDTHELKMAGRNQSMELGTGIVKPGDSMRLAFDLVVGKLSSDGNAHSTYAFKNGSGAIVYGLQYNKDGKLYFFTENTISKDCNGNGDAMAFTKSAVLLDSVKESAVYRVEISILGTKAIAKITKDATPDDKTTVTAIKTLSLADGADVSVIKTVASGNYRQGATDGKVSNIMASTIITIDPNAMEIQGDNEFAKVSGKTVTREFTADPTVVVEGETYSWSIKEGSVEGVTLEADPANSAKATLSVTDAAAAGNVTLVATSSESAEKTAEYVVAVKDFATISSATIVGKTTFEKAGETETYTLSNIVDQYGDDVTPYFVDTATWESSQQSVATITAKGALTVVAKGKTDIIATVGNPGKTMNVTQGIVVDTFSKVVESPVSTEIDVSDLVAYGAPSYSVTVKTAAGATTSVKTASENKITLDTVDGVEAVEIVPNYKFNLGGSTVDGFVSIGTDATFANGYGLSKAGIKVTGAGTGVQADGINLDSASFDIALPDGTYDFTFSKAETARTNISVNGALVGVRVDMFAGYSGFANGAEAITVPAVYTAKDVKVTGGKAVITTENEKNANSAAISAIEITKKSVYEERKTHLWIGGDSTVCAYYPSTTTDNWAGGERRAGWGQLLDKYLTDDIIIDNFAQAGAYATGWYKTFQSVMANAQAGDYMLIQFGINDQTYSSTTEMTEYLDKMVTEAKAAGVIPILVTPQHSIQKWGLAGDYEAPEGGGTQGFRTAITNYCTENNVLLIDLGELTREWFKKVGKPYVMKNYYMYGLNSSTGEYQLFDNLHLSYQGAKKCAELVATNIYDQIEAGTTDASGKDMSGIKTNPSGTYDFTYTDSTGSETTETITAVELDK